MFLKVDGARVGRRLKERKIYSVRRDLDEKYCMVQSLRTG